ncbi:MAG TPA: hypothetical protein VIL54_01680 [Natronosporangium sp.]|jgi:hypothetical protein
MPEVDPDQSRRHARVTARLLWAGVGLAPLAGLVLLVSGGGGVLFGIGVILIVAAVVLVGVAMLQRPDPSTVRAAMEEMLLEEIELLREDLRRDIASAARATHRGFEDRLREVQRSVDALRAELDAARAMGGFGSVGQPPPVVATATAAVPPPSGVYQAGADAPRPAAGRAHVPTGMVRHTETVHQVTTRSTYVDQPAPPLVDQPPPPLVDQPPPPQPAPQPAYEGGYHRHREEEPVSAAPEWNPPRRRRAAEDEESWTDQVLRQRYGRPRLDRTGEPEADRWEPASGRGQEGRRRRADRDGASDRPSTDLGAQRWASHRHEDRAEELRMGERRAAMRASDSGTELRVEDRWAAVRREWDLGDSGEYDAVAGRGEPRALPSSSDAPSWNAEWDEPVREPRGRRHRRDDDDYAPARHRLSFDESDERWR